jgi:hypothetical protein
MKHIVTFEVSSQEMAIKGNLGPELTPVEFLTVLFRYSPQWRASAELAMEDSKQKVN